MSTQVDIIQFYKTKTYNLWKQAGHCVIEFEILRRFRPMRGIEIVTLKPTKNWLSSYVILSAVNDVRIAVKSVSSLRKILEEEKLTFFTG